MDDVAGKVGPFFYLDGQIISDSIVWPKAERYGDFKTWGSHDRFWGQLVKSRSNAATREYATVPRAGSPIICRLRPSSSI